MAKSRRQLDPDLPAHEAAYEADDAGRGHNDTEADARASRNRIAERAYELYLARGGSDGQDWEDWLLAERELTSGRPSRED